MAQTKKKVMKRCGFVFVLALAMSLFMTSSAFADEQYQQVNTWDDLVVALEHGGEYMLADDVLFEEGSRDLVIPSGSHVTLDLNGLTIDRGSNSDNDIVTNPVISVNGGELTLIDSGDGGTITGAKTTNNGNDGGVCVASGTFEMNGGTISGNIAKSGGGVSVLSGTFHMNGGTIQDNVAAGSTDNKGGGVYVSGGEFTMEGGTISGNVCPNGGGAAVENEGLFILNGGVIENNRMDSSSDGGGVWVNAEESFFMHSGVIKGNKATNGGGVCVHGGSAEMTGGTIKDNEAVNGAGVYVKNDGPYFTMTGGTISGNNAENSGGGICVPLAKLVISASDNKTAEIINNTARTGGGVALIGYASQGKGSTLTLGGDVQIDGNRTSSSSDGVGNNVYLDTAYDKIVLGRSIQGSNIGVTMKTPDVFTSGDAVHASDYEDCFFSDNGKYCVEPEGNELKLAEATEYPLWVGATRVTQANKDDVLGDGKVTFDPEKKTLTMDDPTIPDVYSDAFSAVIYTRLDTLVIKGKASLINPGTDNNSQGIYATKCNLEINGDLTVKAENYCIGAKSLNVSGGTLDIENGVITVTRDLNITGGNVIANSKGVAVNSYGGINIIKGSLDASTSSAYGVAVHSRDEMIIGDGMEITKPEGGTIGQKEEEGSKFWTVLDGGNAANSVTIEKRYTVTFNDGQGGTLKTEKVRYGEAATPPADPARDGYLFDGWDNDFSNITEDLTVTARWNKTYPVWVGSTQVTEKNKDDVLGDGGKATYDPDTKTLTLNDPEIKDVYSRPSSLDACIYSESDKLVIKGSANLTNPGTTSASNGIYAPSGCGLELDGEFTIKAEYYGIGANNITISGGNINVTSMAGVLGSNIDIKGGTLTSFGRSVGLSAFKTLSISDGLSIVRPSGGKIFSDEYYKWIGDADGNYASVVVISSEPDLSLVTFVDGQGNTLKAEAVKSGQAATAPADPTREGYVFTGWDKDFSSITEDLTVTAQWKENAAPQAPISIKNAKVVLSASNFAYNGKVRKPSIKKIGGKALKSGTDYTAKWSVTSPKNVGSYTVTITGKGAYTGVTKATYKINPKGTSLKTLKKGKKSITVKWKKQSAKMSKARITGYQIQLATNSKFTKNKKTVTVKGYKKISKKVKKLKGGKKYYVKIRTYKTIKGKKFYSKWSKVKTIKTKK